MKREPIGNYDRALKLWRTRLYDAQLSALAQVMREARGALEMIDPTVPTSEADLLAVTQISHEIARRLREIEQDIAKLLGT